ncbi:MAG TPA: carboxypeptidase-like regulatory domain-containing protein [Edaphobacter sp.]|nr:carboxypeptidase-like regulatory domain-containing protein [Edaphobacter sp.]
MASALQLPASTSAADPVTLSGTVLNAVTGAPVSRALVKIADRAMLTDRLGRFEFDRLAASGGGIVEVRKPGFYFGSTGGTTTILFPDQMRSQVVFRLYPEALMTGTVTASDGSPLPHVFLTAMRSIYNESGHQWFPMGHSLTNSRGEFRMTVPPGDYRIETNFSMLLPGSSDAVLPVRLPSTPDGVIHLGSGSQQQFELHPVVGRTYPVRVKVVLPQRQGFPSLLVKAADGAIFPAHIDRREDVDDGETQIALPSGTFTLVGQLSRAGGMEYGETEVSVADHAVEGVVLQLAPVAPIPVQMVVDSDSTSDKTPTTSQQLGMMLQNVQGPGVGASSFPVMVQNQEASFRPTPGVYRLVGRNYGHWFISSASCGTSDLLKQDIQVSWGGGASAPIVVTVSNQSGGLQGMVQLRGAGASIWVYAIPDGPTAVLFYTIRSNANGSYSFSSLPPGTYRLVAFEERRWASYSDPEVLRPYATYVHSIVITAGNTLTLNLDAVPSAEMVQ